MDSPTTDVYTLSLHDAPSDLPHAPQDAGGAARSDAGASSHRRRPAASASRAVFCVGHAKPDRDRKSTRLNSSHGYISYAVFCLKKKKTKKTSKQITIDYLEEH